MQGQFVPVFCNCFRSRERISIFKNAPLALNLLRIENSQKKRNKLIVKGGLWQAKTAASSVLPVQAAKIRCFQQMAQVVEQLQLLISAAR